MWTQAKNVWEIPCHSDSPANNIICPFPMLPQTPKWEGDYAWTCQDVFGSFLIPLGLIFDHMALPPQSPSEENNQEAH